MTQQTIHLILAKNIIKNAENLIVTMIKQGMVLTYRRLFLASKHALHNLL